MKQHIVIPESTVGYLLPKSFDSLPRIPCMTKLSNTSVAEFSLS